MRRATSASRLCNWLMSMVLLLGLCATAAAEMPSAGYIRSLRGRVECRRVGTREWIPVRRSGFVLRPGDLVRTDAKGACVLVIGGTQVKVGPNSTVRLPDAPPRRGFWYRLKLLIGRIVVGVIGDQRIEVLTPAAKASARGTTFEVVVDENGVTTVTVAEGTVEVSNAAGAVQLNSDQQTQVRPGQAPSPPIAVNAAQTMIWQAELSSLPVAPEVRLAPQTPPADLPEAAEDAAGKAERQPDNLDAQLKAAALLHDAGEVERAETVARRAASLAPTDERAVATLALVLLAEGRASEAEELLKSVAAGPWRALAEGCINLRIGTREALEKSLSLFRSAAGELAEAQVHLAMAAMRLGQAATAEKAVAAVLKAYPNDYRALALRACLQLSAGDLSAAQGSAEAALRAGPETGLAHEVAALVALFSGELDRAREHIQRSLEIRPTPSARASAADIYAASDDLDSALAHALAAVAADPWFGPAWRVLGMVYAAQGAYPAAAKALTRAVELQPQMVTAYSTLAVVYSRQGKVAQALRQLQVALSLGSASPQIENDLGALLVNLGRIKEGIQHLERAAALAREAGQEWAMPYANLALAYLDLNRFAEAEQYVLRALALGERSAPVHTIAARVYMEQRRYQRAWAELREALDIDPDYALARVKLAEIYHLIGQDREAAKEVLEAGFTDAGAMVEERFYSRTELRAQAGSERVRLKTDGRSGEGRVGYFLSYAEEDPPKWRMNGDWHERSAEALAGRLAGNGSRDFVRISAGWVRGGRPGPETGPDNDPNYSFRASQFTAEAGRRLRISKRGTLTVAARYRRTTYRASNPDSMAVDPATGAIVDPKPYLHRETDETRTGVEVCWRQSLGHDWQLKAGAAGEWGNDRARGLLWQVVSTPSGTVAGHQPYRCRRLTSAGTGYVELVRRTRRDVVRLGGYVAIAEGLSPVWRPRLVWERELSGREKLWLSTCPIMRDDISLLSPTDPWRQDHGLQWIDFAPGGFGQFTEARYQLQCRGGGLLQLVGFHREYTGLLIPLVNPRWQPEGGYYVVAYGRACGGQLVYEQPLTPRLTGAVQVTYTDSKDEATGRDLPYTPRWRGSAGMYYKDPNGWRVEALWKYVGSRWHLGPGGATARAGGYSTVDLYVSRQLSTAWEVFVHGTNIFDREYCHWLGFPELGRHIAIGFEYRFW